MFSVLLSVIVQYWIAPYIKTDKLDFAWGCDGSLDEKYYEACRGNMAVMRVSFCTTIFFLVCTFFALLHSGFNRSFWGLKFLAYIILIVGVMFAPSAIFESDGLYIKFARIGAAVFIVLQQVILIDLAYNWNDAWVANADEDESQEAGSGAVWLKALLGVSASIFIASWMGIGFLFKYFNGEGCTDNTNGTFIGLTLGLTLFATLIQLTGEEGSMLTSAILTLYSVYLCYSAVSLNPDEDCNPTLGSDNYISLIIGVFLLVASIAWTGYSASSTIPGLFEEGTGAGAEAGAGAAETGNVSLIDDDGASKSTVTGVVTGDANNYGSTKKEGSSVHDGVRNSITGEGDSSEAWKLNVVLIFICLWYPMVLTGWGSIRSDGEVANASKGATAMWMMMVGQWTALALYSWTLLAPRLFPDRDFS